METVDNYSVLKMQNTLGSSLEQLQNLIENKCFEEASELSAIAFCMGALETTLLNNSKCPRPAAFRTYANRCARRPHWKGLLNVKMVIETKMNFLKLQNI